MWKLMGKSVPVSAHIFFFKQSSVDEYRSGLNLDNSVLLIFFVIHRDKAVFKYSLAEDVSRFLSLHILSSVCIQPRWFPLLVWIGERRKDTCRFGNFSKVRLQCSQERFVCRTFRSWFSLPAFLSLSIKSCHSSSVASRSFAVLRAETITRLSFRKAFRSFGIGFLPSAPERQGRKTFRIPLYSAPAYSPFLHDFHTRSRFSAFFQVAQIYGRYVNQLRKAPQRYFLIKTFVSGIRQKS